MHYSDLRTFHVGIIMDGNGRWATERGLNRISGHSRGARRVSEIVRACPDLGVTHLTLYAFSTENWRRPLEEVEGLMRIFRQYIRNKMESLRAHDVRVQFIGMRHRLPQRLQRLIDDLEDQTRDCQGLRLTIAIDYGGRDEIVRAVQKISGDLKSGKILAEDITESLMSRSLDTAHLPDPDLIVRTSGEHRVSNFLLWQAVYAEYVFPPITWPEFSASSLEDAVASYRTRQRRFGEVSEPATGLAALGGR